VKSLPAVFSLGLLAAVCAALLAVLAALAAPAIEAQHAAERQRQLDAVLASVRYDNQPAADVLQAPDPCGGAAPTSIFRAREGDRVVARVYACTTPHGYSGDIALLIGVDANGRLRGVRVQAHHETPGLGDAIELRRSNWVLGFDGRALGDPPLEGWALRSDGGIFDAFTGASITPRAVVEAVRAVLVFDQAQRSEIDAATANISSSVRFDASLKISAADTNAPDIDMPPQAVARDTPAQAGENPAPPAALAHSTHR